MYTGKIFPNGRSQAVRLPKECRFESDEVCVNKVGDVVLLFPRESGWEILSRSLQDFSEDYMAEREQPRSPEHRTGL